MKVELTFAQLCDLAPSVRAETSKLIKLTRKATTTAKTKGKGPAKTMPRKRARFSVAAVDQEAARQPDSDHDDMFEKKKPQAGGMTIKGELLPERTGLLLPLAPSMITNRSLIRCVKMACQFYD